MTNKDKEMMLFFILKTGMYIGKVEQGRIECFLHGYETRNPTNGLTKLIEMYLREKKIEYSSDGWPGQIRRYAIKKNLDWITAFKEIGLEVMALNGGFTKKMKIIIRAEIERVIESLNDETHSLTVSSWWLKKWQLTCKLKSDWFIEIWSPAEFKIIKRIDQHIQRGEVFEPIRVKPLKFMSDLSKSFKEVKSK